MVDRRDESNHIATMPYPVVGDHGLVFYGKALAVFRHVGCRDDGYHPGHAKRAADVDTANAGMVVRAVERPGEQHAGQR